MHLKWKGMYLRCCIPPRSAPVSMVITERENPEDVWRISFVNDVTPQHEEKYLFDHLTG